MSRGTFITTSIDLFLTFMTSTIASQYNTVIVPLNLKTISVPVCLLSYKCS